MVYKNKVWILKFGDRPILVDEIFTPGK